MKVYFLQSHPDFPGNNLLFEIVLFVFVPTLTLKMWYYLSDYRMDSMLLLLRLIYIYIYIYCLVVVIMTMFIVANTFKSLCHSVKDVDVLHL